MGYLEKETYDQLDDDTANAGDENYTKYQRDLAKIGYFNSSKKGVAWCAVFVAWCPVQVFGEALAKKLLCQPDKGNCGAGCNSQMTYYKAKDCWYTEDPQPGDQIIFWNSEKTEGSHTGWVYKVEDGYVYTVEGNTSAGNKVIENGGGVAKKKYKLNNARIAGYGRPRWEVITEIGPDISDLEEEKIETEPVELENAWVKSKNGTTVNFRTGPRKSAKLVPGCPRIKTGELVCIKTRAEGWAAIEYKDYRGYMMTEFLVSENPNHIETKEPEVESPAATPNEPRRYTTVTGDTLWGIAQKYYGSGIQYKKIMKANRMKNTIVRPGMVLKIPEE